MQRKNAGLYQQMHIMLNPQALSLQITQKQKPKRPQALANLRVRKLAERLKMSHTLGRLRLTQKNQVERLTQHLRIVMSLTY